MIVFRLAQSLAIPLGPHEPRAVLRRACASGLRLSTLLSVLPTRDPDARARRLQGIVCWGFRTMHDWLRFIRIIDFNPREVDGALLDGPCIVVANHRTLTDITSIMASFGPMTAAVKPEIFQCGGCGH